MQSAFLTNPSPPSLFEGVPASGLDRFALAHEPAGAYQWWYFDALSDDGRYGLVAIYFVGGVFSALYADRLQDGIAASPLDHPMVNLALYDRRKKIAWVFSEYPREQLEVVDPCLDLSIGGSRVRRLASGSYEWTVNDRDFAAGRDVQARALFHPLAPAIAPPDAVLSSDGRHSWGSPAPRCRVEFSCPSLGLSWKGHGYHDMNAGLEPLFAGFREWGWGRAHLGDETRIYYDALEADGTRVRRILTGRDGRLDHQQVPATSEAQREWTGWLLHLPREPEAGHLNGEIIRVKREAMWEHSPFYARWVGRFSNGTEASRGVCEHVDLQRFASPFIRWMLRYRIYRRRADGGVFPAHVRRQVIFPHDPA